MGHCINHPISCPEPVEGPVPLRDLPSAFSKFRAHCGRNSNTLGPVRSKNADVVTTGSRSTSNIVVFGCLLRPLGVARFRESLTRVLAPP